MNHHGPKLFNLVRAALVLGTLALGGCQDKPAKTEAVASVSAAAPKGIVVAADGTRFDPPVAKESIPGGSWMCEMNGQVHYAAKNKGDGKCPVCSMGLVLKEHGGKAPMAMPHASAGHMGHAGAAAP